MLTLAVTKGWTKPNQIPALLKMRKDT